MTNSASATTRATSAYVVQSVLSFAIALVVVVIGECSLPVPGWTRAFLALGTLYLVSATFTLAKCIRDQHESTSMVGRLDQARIERLLAEFDPYRPPPVAQPLAAPAGQPSFPQPPSQPLTQPPAQPPTQPPTQPSLAYPTPYPHV